MEPIHMFFERKIGLSGDLSKICFTSPDVRNSCFLLIWRFQRKLDFLTVIYNSFDPLQLRQLLRLDSSANTHISRPTLSQSESFKISRTTFLRYGQLGDLPILRLGNCGRAGRRVHHIRSTVASSVICERASNHNLSRFDCGRCC